MVGNKHLQAENNQKVRFRHQPDTIALWHILFRNKKGPVAGALRFSL
jgi:hypothetical protein